MNDQPNMAIVDEDVANDVVREVYRALPSFRVRDGAITPEDVDAAQEIAEKLETMRVRLDGKLTVDDLANMQRETVQQIAQDAGIVFKKNTTTATIIKKIVEAGVHKSVRPRRQLKAAFGRLKWARDKIEYHHPRQTAGADTASEE